MYVGAIWRRMYKWHAWDRLPMCVCMCVCRLLIYTLVLQLINHLLNDFIFDDQIFHSVSDKILWCLGELQRIFSQSLTGFAQVNSKCAHSVHRTQRNRPNSQIPQCIYPISHNALLRTEIHTYVFWMVHHGIWDRCIVGFWHRSICDQ